MLSPWANIKADGCENIVIECNLVICNLSILNIFGFVMEK